MLNNECFNLKEKKKKKVVSFCQSYFLFEPLHKLNIISGNFSFRKVMNRDLKQVLKLL